MDVWFRRLQLLSAAALSFSHGTNDAQKTMGIITEVLVTAKNHPGVQGADLADSGRARGDCARNIFRRLAYRSYDGQAVDTAEARTGFCAETGAAGAVCNG
jgi:PiT family inorganic phosphate transporter